MPTYLIVNYDIEDADLYREYQGGAAAALKIGTDCKLLVLDPKSEHLEGESTGQQTVVLEFESRTKAKELYDSGAYPAVIGKRLKATSKHFAVLVDGFDSPS